MSMSVDERVVKMEFDNANFEKNVTHSLSTLERLKESLNFEGAVRNLTNLKAAGKNFALDGISTAVENVSYKFSMLETIGIGALIRIGMQAADTGERLIKSLSVDQISAGWQKFGEKTTSVATLVSQGYALETVNEQLSKLNWYTDESSYNFTDMVSNIAKFTATGQTLETSVTAMEGIANWAALSGQNAMTASRAMYQLSQAMGSGFMRKEDYKSIQNASMDTQEFRQKCLDAGVALGRLKKNADDTYTSIAKEGKETTFGINQFADTLTASLWLNSDVMMKVFNDYSSAVDTIYEVSDAMDLTASQVISAKEALDKGEVEFNKYAASLELTAAQTEKLKEAASQIDDFGIKAFRSAQEARTFGDVIDSVKDAVSTGWMNVFETLIGSYDDAKNLWTGLANYLYDVFMAPIDSILGVLTEWRALMGREKLLDGFSALARTGENIGRVLRNAFEGIFDPFEGRDLAVATRSFKEFFESISGAFGEITEEGFVLTNLGKGIQNAFSGVFAVVDIAWQTVKAIAGGVITVAKSLAPIAGAIIGSLGSLGSWITNLDKALKETNAIGDAVQYVANLIAEAIGWITPYILGLQNAFSDLYALIAKKFEAVGITSLGDAVEKLKEKFAGLEPIVTRVRDTIGGAFDWLASHISLKSLEATFTNFGSVLSSVFKIVSTVGKKIGDVLGSIFDAFTKNYNAGLGVATEVGVIGILYTIRDFIKSGSDTIGELKGFTENITKILDGVRETLEAYQTNLKADSLLKIAGAVGILAASLLVLSTIDSDKIAGPLLAISALLAEVTAAFIVLNKLTAGSGDDSGGGGIFAPIKAIVGGIQQLGSAAEVAAQATTMVMLAGAVLILSTAVKHISSLDLKEVAIGLTGVTILLGELIATTKMLNGAEVVSGASGLIAMAVALRILASGVETLGQMDFIEMIQGLTGIMVLLAGLTASISKAGSAEHMISVGVGLIAIAGALKIIASVVDDLGGMDFGNMLQGMGAFSIALLALTLAMNEMPSDGHMISAGVGLIAIAGAMKIIAGVIDTLGNMTFEEVGQGFIAMAASLTALCIALNLCNGSLAGAASLLIISSALAILVPTIAALGALPLSVIVQGLLTLTVAIGGLLAAAIGAEAVAPGLAILAASMLAISASAAILGVAFVTIGAGMLSMAAGFTALATAGAVGATAVVAAITTIITGVIGMVPAIAASIVEGIVTIVSLIAQNAPVIVGSILTIATQVIAALTTLIPQVVGLVATLIKSILACIQQVAPEIIKSVFVILETLLNNITEFVPKVVEAFYNMLLSILTVIEEKIPIFIEKGVSIIEALIDGISKAVPELVDHGIKAIINLINGLAEAIRGNTDELISAVNNLMDAIIEAIAAYFTNFFDKGVEIVDNVINGIGSISKSVIEAGYNIVAGLIEGISNGVGEIYDTIVNVGKGLLSKLKGSLEENSPSKATIEMGEYVDEGLVIGIQNGEKDVSEAAENLGESVLDGVEEPLSDGAVAINEFVKTYEEGLETLTRTLPITDTTTKYNSLDEVMTGLSSTVEAFESRYGESIRDMTDGANSVEMAKAVIYEFGTKLAFANEQTVTLGKTTEEVTKQIQERYEKVYQAVKSYSDGLKNTIYGQLDVFSEFEDDTEDATDSSVILDNMESWANATDEWAENLAAMADRGLHQGMLEKLAEMGPKGRKSLESFVNMTDEQLQKFNVYWENATSVAQAAADKITSAMIHTGSMADMGLAQGIRENKNAAVDEMVIVSEATINAAHTAFDEHSPSRVMHGIGVNVDEGLANGIIQNQSSPANSAKRMATEIITRITESLSDQVLDGIGRHICNGLAAGIRANSEVVVSAARSLANSIRSIVEDELEINSPSRVFDRIGRFVDLGMAQGIRGNLNYAVDAVSSMGDAALEAMRLSVANLQSLINDEIDFNPTITPQLDLSNLKNNLASVGGLFGSESLSLNAKNQNGISGGRGTTFSFVQNNYSPKALSRTEIYRQTKNQFTRMKGLVGGV